MSEPREPSFDTTIYAQAMARNLYFLGTAGSGKSTMVYAFQLWMNSQGLDCVTVNLDPGAEALQYSPDLDVRDYVNLEEVMAEQGLGPNGAQVAAADMAAMNAKELADVLETFETNYVLIDTPGQIELFTFRASGPVLIDAFGRADSALVYLNDPALVKTASGFISSVLLNATVQFRHGLPFINVLSKADLLPERELEKIVKWSLDPFALYEALFEEAATPKTLLDVEFLKSMETIGVYRRVHPVSSELTFGFEEIYSQVQQVFEGGEEHGDDRRVPPRPPGVIRTDVRLRGDLQPSPAGLRRRRGLVEGLNADRPIRALMDHKRPSNALRTSGYFALIASRTADVESRFTPISETARRTLLIVSSSIRMRRSLIR